jgi:very-short-patch-repair endonuclease
MQHKNTKTKVNENDPNTFVVCYECDTKHPQITHTHLKRAHGISLDVYVAKHNLTKADLSCSNVRALRKATLNNMIKKYGEVEGNYRWEQYRQRQSYTNSFEYKQQKHGWTREEYDAYNNKRASTKQNFIKRYGVEEGTEKWNNYRKHQSYAGVAEEYFIEKYGTIKGAEKFKEVCSKKANTLETFIARYGEILGKEKWERICEKHSLYKRQSNLANILFADILANISKEMHDTIFFDYKNYEYFFAKRGHKTMFVDFYCASTKKIIEFAGDYWHGNPQIYDSTFFNKQANTTAGDLYTKTLERINLLEHLHGCKVLLIWENNYKRNKEQVTQQCLTFLNE